MTALVSRPADEPESDGVKWLIAITCATRAVVVGEWAVVEVSSFVSRRGCRAHGCDYIVTTIIDYMHNEQLPIVTMDVTVERIGRDRLILIGTPTNEDEVPEGHHNCDYMGCGTQHVVGRALLLKADGDRPKWNRSQAMARQLDAVAFQWGPEPLSAGDYWILWGSSGQRSAVHFDPLNGVAYVDADNQPDDDNRFRPESRCRFRDRYWPDNPSSVSQADDDVEQLDHSRATPVTAIGRNAPHIVVMDQTPIDFDPWPGLTAVVIDVRGPGHGQGTAVALSEEGAMLLRRQLVGDTPEQLRATAMALLARANVLDEETQGCDLDSKGRTLSDWAEIFDQAARAARDEAYGGGTLLWLAEELEAEGYSVKDEFPSRTRQQVVDGGLNVFGLDLLFKSAEELLPLLGISRIAGTTDYRGNRWRWSVELVKQETSP